MYTNYLRDMFNFIRHMKLYCFFAQVVLFFYIVYKIATFH